MNQAKKKNRRMIAFMVIIFIGLGAISLTAAFQKNKKKVTAGIVTSFNSKETERTTHSTGGTRDRLIEGVFLAPG